MTDIRYFLAALALLVGAAANISAQNPAPQDEPLLPATDPSAAGPSALGPPTVGPAGPSAIDPPSAGPSAGPSSVTDQPTASPLGGRSTTGGGGGFGGFPGFGGFGGFDGGIGSATISARFVASGAIIVTWSEKKDAAWGFSKTTGKWTRQELDPPATAPPTVGRGLGVIQAGSTLYAYSGQSGRWDVLRLPADHKPQFGIHEEFVLVNDGADIYTFADATGRWTSPGGENINEVAETVTGGFLFGQGVADEAPIANLLAGESTSIENLRRKYQESDQSSAELARQYREQSLTKGPNHPDLQRLKEQLAAAVKQAFQTRQQLHQVELAEFQRRMQDIQRTIEARQRIQDEIIERRVSELVDPSLRWDASRQTGGPGTPIAGQTAPAFGGRPSEGVANAGQQTVKNPPPINPPTEEGAPARRRPQRELGQMPSAEQLVYVGVVSEASDPERIVVSSAEIGGIRAGEELLVIRRVQVDELVVDELVGRMEIVQADAETATGRVLVTRRVLVLNRYEADKIRPGDILARVLVADVVEPLGPPVDAAREASMNNLKQLMLAMHNYHDTHQRFPPAVILGRDGQGGPPHSWRVGLLPFLNQQALYNEYRFEEPWDSEHNRALVAKMPAVFRSPLDEPDSTNASYFALVTPGFAPDVPGALFGVHGSGGTAPPGTPDAPVVPGPAIEGGAAGIAPGDFTASAAVEPSWYRGTLFSRPDGARLSEIIDGTSHTIAVVEAKRNIPWTRPHDLAYVADQSLPVLGGWFPEGWHAGFADGSVKFLSSDNDDATIRALFTIGDGENVQPKLVESQAAEKH